MATIEQFQAIEMRVGRVIRVEPFPEARKPAWKLWIDFGPHGVKRSSAQITDLYAAQDLVGRPVVAVTNFPPRQIGPFLSEVLVLGAMAEDGVHLLRADGDVELGTLIG